MLWLHTHLPLFLKCITVATLTPELTSTVLPKTQEGICKRSCFLKIPPHSLPDWFLSVMTLPAAVKAKHLLSVTALPHRSTSSLENRSPWAHFHRGCSSSVIFFATKQTNCRVDDLLPVYTDMLSEHERSWYRHFQMAQC